MRSVRTTLGTAAAGLWFLAAPAVSQQPAATETSPHGYQGVIPGTDQPPAVAPDAAKTTITWPGFQMRPDGGSRFFVQASGPMSPQLHVTDKRVTVTLGAATLGTRVNGLILETRFFNTPVKRAFVTLDKGVAYLVLDMRQGATPTVSSERAKTGFHFVYVDFAPGNYLGGETFAAPSKPAPARPGTVRMPPPDSLKAPPASLQGDAATSGSAGGGASGSLETSSDGGKSKAKAEGKVKFGL